MKPAFKIGDSVRVTGLHPPRDNRGTVTNVRVDTRGVNLYTVEMADPLATLNGLCYCRDYELRPIKSNLA